MASQQTNVDWFSFWLKGGEDADPVKPTIHAMAQNFVKNKQSEKSEGKNLPLNKYEGLRKSLGARLGTPGLPRLLISFVGVDALDPELRITCRDGVSPLCKHEGLSLPPLDRGLFVFHEIFTSFRFGFASAERNVSSQN